jgi:hypothetical protein
MGTSRRSIPTRIGWIELRASERVYRGDAGTFVKRLDGGAWRIESDLPDVPY